jgi:hypothetical protein
MKRMRAGICRLCRQQALLAHSHIIPEFFYKPLYDEEQHSFRSVSWHPYHSINKPFQKGFREHMLCLKCEGNLSEWEKYTSEVVEQVWEQSCPDTDFIHVSPFDYAKFKLCAMSIIWRCHESSLPFCRDVNLGTHSNRIRKMLLNDEPGKPNEYGLFIFKIEGADKANTVIVPPKKVKYGRLPAYYLLALGFKWVFIPIASFATEEKHRILVGLDSELAIPKLRMKNEEFYQELEYMMSPETKAKVLQARIKQ